MNSYLVFLCFTLVSLIMCHQRHAKRENAHHQKMHNPKMAQDADHIKEHLKEKIDVKKEMSNEEIEFYYFLEHDFNNDSRLDGLEIFAAIKHSDFAFELSEDAKNLTGQNLIDAHNKEIETYAELIDEIMREDDTNKDGYLSYLEYVFARRRDARNEEKERKNKS